MDSCLLSEYPCTHELFSFNHMEDSFAEEILSIFNNCNETINPCLMDYFQTQAPEIFFNDPYTLQPQTLQFDEYESLYSFEPVQKRLKPWTQNHTMETQYNQYINSSDSYSDMYFSQHEGNYWPMPDYMPETAFPAKVPPFSGGVMQKPAEILSAQSIAARQRRKKISEKTRELGKLIPNGTKLNTAEMLQEASQYVNFLQAQLSLLKLMDSTSTPIEEELGVLCGSLTIQEKLCEEGKCLASTKFMKSLVQDSKILGDHALSKDLMCLIQSLET
ncbi:hypothetical protein AMTRI_Chr07g29680 [Amborella trichopoda]|uniref:BHLH domain-containing protein n=1 Tax=Amborella trichopoda TaxID=13333 RepID=W1NHF6_AMBTC|nr:transcription factor bHLH53 [Amborella trichopoda]ERM94916.1 hypothetical protein AMTR_s00009p00173620 [Amborella trichopoda]|eukprot:XP_006827500.1 transcription factor bHLH53 [Amborella trichopoda]